MYCYTQNLFLKPLKVVNTCTQHLSLYCEGTLTNDATKRSDSILKNGLLFFV